MRYSEKKSGVERDHLLGLRFFIEHRTGSRSVFLVALLAFLVFICCFVLIIWIVSAGNFIKNVFWKERDY